MKIWIFKPKTLRSGFSLVEMIVVIAIMGILLGIAIPTYISVVPTTELKGDSRKIAFALQRARQVSSSYNRPARVLLDCTGATLGYSGNACRLQVQLSVYDNTGLIRRWVPVQSGKMDLSAGLRFRYDSDYTIKRGQFDSYRSLFNGFSNADGTGSRSYGVTGKDGFAGDSLVVVYVPSGEAITYSKVSVTLYSTKKDNALGWVLDVMNSTGYARLKQVSA
ncbi:MAG: prepilin-type N-terminal cleavage/methylation domain-containing protein [Deltaproteobacteria bacterium]|jgi:prepilin-type N-terminal cleavage/methylation domain-containing protein|nr:prepilin-type N-terminal cleavage/methylation domain-containing protein [Deltaproteobacteria bacterium]